MAKGKPAARGKAAPQLAKAAPVVAPQDAVGLGVVSPYGAGKHSVHFACNEANAGLVTYVVVDPTNDAGPTQPVTLHKVVP